jgi:hypothetical protein
MAPFCASSARLGRTTISSTSCTNESPLQASTTRRIVLSGLGVLGSSTHPLQRKQRGSTTQAVAAAMPAKLIDAHVHVWAAVEDARSGKYPYYVSRVLRVCGPSTPGGGEGEAHSGVREPGRSKAQAGISLLGLTSLLPSSLCCLKTCFSKPQPTLVNLPPSLPLPAGSDAGQQHSLRRRATHARARAAAAAGHAGT